MSFGSVSGVDLNHVGDTAVTVPNPAGDGGGPFVVTKLGLADVAKAPNNQGLRLALFGGPAGALPYQGYSPAWSVVAPGKIGFAPYDLNSFANVVLTGDSATVYVRVTQVDGQTNTGTVSVYAESVGA